MISTTTTLLDLTILNSLKTSYFYCIYKSLTLLKYILSILLCTAVVLTIHGQESVSDEKLDANRNHSIGFTIGKASQKTFPLTNDEYIYSTTSVKLQYDRKLWDWGKWDAHILVEPSYYRVDHQLLNFFFIVPEDPNFQERRDRFTQPRSFDEWALNVGLRVSRPLTDRLSGYGMLSSGPMYQGDSTERLKRGFTFSNVLGAGIQFQFAQRFKWDLRAVLRHTSNAGTQIPNSGHNSFGGETGLIYILD